MAIRNTRTRLIAAKRSGHQTSTGVLEMSSLLMYKALQNWSLGISKIMKKYLFAYFSSRAVVSGQGKTVHWGYNFLLYAVEREIGMPMLEAHFAKGNGALDLKGAYTNNGTWGMLELWRLGTTGYDVPLSCLDYGLSNRQRARLPHVTCSHDVSRASSVDEPEGS